MQFITRSPRTRVDDTRFEKWQTTLLLTSHRTARVTHTTELNLCGTNSTKRTEYRSELKSLRLGQSSQISVCLCCILHNFTLLQILGKFTHVNLLQPKSVNVQTVNSPMIPDMFTGLSETILAIQGVQQPPGYAWGMACLLNQAFALFLGSHEAVEPPFDS